MLFITIQAQCQASSSLFTVVGVDRNKMHVAGSQAMKCSKKLLGGFQNQFWQEDGEAKMWLK